MQSVGSVKIMTAVEAGAEGSLLTPSVVPGAVIADFDALLNAAAIPATDPFSTSQAIVQAIKLTPPGDILPEAASPESGEMVNGLAATMRLATRGMTAREPMAKIAIKIEAPIPALSPEIQIRTTDGVQPTLDTSDSTQADRDLLTQQPLPVFIPTALQPVTQDTEIDLVDGEALTQQPVVDEAIPARATIPAPTPFTATAHEIADTQMQEKSIAPPASPQFVSADKRTAQLLARLPGTLSAQLEAPDATPETFPRAPEYASANDIFPPAQPVHNATEPTQATAQTDVQNRPVVDRQTPPETQAPDPELAKQVAAVHISTSVRLQDRDTSDKPTAVDEPREILMSEFERVNAIASTIASMIPKEPTPIANAQGEVENLDDETTRHQPMLTPLMPSPKLVSRDASTISSKTNEAAVAITPRPPEAGDLARIDDPDALAQAHARLQQVNSSPAHTATPSHPEQDFVARPAPAGRFGPDDQAKSDEQAQQEAQRHADEQDLDTNVSRDEISAGSNLTRSTRDGDKNAIRDIEITHMSKSEVVSRVVQENPRPMPELPPTAPANASIQQIVVSNSDTGASNSRAQANEIRMRALEKQVVAAAREGSDTIRMQLYPPGLGQVVIRLTMEGGRLRLASRTMNQEATEAMLQIEKDLREALAGGGLELTQFDVSDEGEREDRRRQPDTKPTIHRSVNPEGFAVDMNA